VKQVQRFLGHADPSLTLRTYIHLLGDDIGEPIARSTACACARVCQAQAVEGGRAGRALLLCHTTNQGLLYGSASELGPHYPQAAEGPSRCTARGLTPDRPGSSLVSKGTVAAARAREVPPIHWLEAMTRAGGVRR
jgi:hypothetical protein